MFYGEKVKLRPLEESDLDNILKHWNDWEIRRTLLLPIPMSRVMEQEWLHNAVRSSPFKDGRVIFAIEDKNTHEFLGTTSLESIRFHNGTAEFGIAIMNKARLGMGYGTDTTTVMLWYGFHILNLHSIYLRVMEYNKRGIRAYEKAGFKQVGRMREQVFNEGKWHDVIIMDILQAEFSEKFPPGTFVGEPPNKQK